MKARLTKAEAAMRKRLSGDGPTVATMSDDELAAVVTGRPDAKAEDLSDEMLERIAGD
jgi:hypothetical protein